MGKGMIVHWLEEMDRYRDILENHENVVMLAVVPHAWEPEEYCLEIGLKVWEPALPFAPPPTIPTEVVEVGNIVTCQEGMDLENRKRVVRLQRRGSEPIPGAKRGFPAMGGYGIGLADPRVGRRGYIDGKPIMGALGPFEDPRVGTLGCAVSIGAEPDPDGFFFLTNWHVTGFSEEIIPMVQPAGVDMLLKDAGTKERMEKHVIGKPWWWRLDEHFDLALINVDRDRRKRIGTGIYDLPIKPGIAVPLEGQPVAKVGRTTGKTEGTLRSAFACVKVGGFPKNLSNATNPKLKENGIRIFKAQLYATRPPDPDEAMAEAKITKPGDSGSILAQGGGSPQSPIGIVFAESNLLNEPNQDGHTAKEISLANPFLNPSATPKVKLFGSMLPRGVDGKLENLRKVLFKSFLT